jgi:hypothetical protein
LCPHVQCLHKDWLLLAFCSSPGPALGPWCPQSSHCECHIMVYVCEKGPGREGGGGGSCPGAFCAGILFLPSPDKLFPSLQSSGNPALGLRPTPNKRAQSTIISVFVRTQVPRVQQAEANSSLKTEAYPPCSLRSPERPPGGPI